MTESVVSTHTDLVYRNEGNPDLLEKVRPATRRLLDVGCGAGDNARLIQQIIPGVTVDGVTASQLEEREARNHMRRCVVANIEDGPPCDFLDNRYDCILFSHVLEHLRKPAKVLAEFQPLLANDGQVLIAVPNIAFFRSRWRLILGRFEYAQSGVFDHTHLRFFTYHSADRMLLKKAQNLDLLEKSVTGSVPLWVFRRYLLPTVAADYLDKLGGKFAPNFFGGQIILDVRKQHALADTESQ
jgi:SAM-dependent methyltransferase